MKEVVNDMKSESVLPFEWNHCPQSWKSWAGQQANSLLKWLDEDRFCKFQQGTLALFTSVPQRTSIHKRVLPLECRDASYISGQKFHRKGKSGLHFGSLTKRASTAVRDVQFPCLWLFAHPGSSPKGNVVIKKAQAAPLFVFIRADCANFCFFEPPLPHSFEHEI